MPIKTVRKISFMVILVLALLIISWIIFINMGSISGKVVEARILEIKKDWTEMINKYGNIDYDLSREQIKKISSQPEDFVILEYHFELKNMSSWKKIWEVKLKPKFPEKIKNSIFAYRKKEPDGLVSPIFIDRKDKTFAQKRIIVMKKFLTGEFFKLIKKVKFKATGKIVISKNEVDFITIGFCSSTLTYKSDFSYYFAK